MQSSRRIPDSETDEDKFRDGYIYKFRHTRPFSIPCSPSIHHAGERVVVAYNFMPHVPSFPLLTRLSRVPMTSGC
jgi:hypothetical protein